MDEKEIKKYLIDEGFDVDDACRAYSKTSGDATMEEIKREAMAAHLHFMGFEDEEIKEILSDIPDDEEIEEIGEIKAIEARAMKKHLEEQGLTKDEADWAVSEITMEYGALNKDSLDAEKIYNSLWALGSYYIENEIESLDNYIYAAVDNEALGEEVAEEEGYLILESGRVVVFKEFQMFR